MPRQLFPLAPPRAAIVLGRAVVGITCLLPGAAAAQDVVINEAMSSNGATILDEDGDSPDWIELHNAGPSGVQLEGYGLSDDAAPLKWVFPSIVLPAGGHRIVFCSGKDRSAVPAHWETVIAQGDTWRYIVPTSEPSAAWRAPGFNDAAWSPGATGIGYGDGDDRTQVPAGTVSVYARKVFQVEDPAKVRRVFLDMDFDDGFVAYLNGVEVARENILDRGRPPAFSEVAATFTEPRLVTGGELFHYRDDSFPSLLRAGENVLAIQVHNSGSGSSDLSLIPFLTLGLDEAPENARGPAEILESALPALHASFKLSSDGETITLASPSGAILDSVEMGLLPPDVSIGRFPDGTGGFSFHAPATPGAPNLSAGYASIGGTATFSHAGGFHPGPIVLTLSKEDPAGAIFVSTDGSVPTEASTRYAAPIRIDATAVARARVLGAGLYPGRTQTHTFVIGRTSTLPVVSISTDPESFFDDETGIYVLGDSYDPSFPYGDSAPWPEEADGNGATLALKNPILENGHAAHWAASPAGGTPGSRNDVFQPIDANCLEETPPLLRGDCDADGTIDIADPIRLLFASFAGASVPCLSACDANGDGSTGGVSDALHLLRYLFLQGPAPVAPFPDCGPPSLATDPVLGCAAPPAGCR
ncbi:MAG: lamin tail domain-containing protein [Planctomycetes bacterium]|nr:lamin tail domain-containing protein [Planctomycetota bacterium]